MLGSVVNPLSASLVVPGMRSSSLPRISVRLTVGGTRFPSTTTVSSLKAAPRCILTSVVLPLLMSMETSVDVASEGMCYVKKHKCLPGVL